MARKKKDTTRRGSPEAIAKRRAARSLNQLFAKGGAEPGLDGRTLKRKRRLMKELTEGKGGAPIKAHEVLTHVTELLALGETMASIRKSKPLVPGPLEINEETTAVIKEMQASYGFDPRAWKVLGIDVEAVISGEAPEPKSTGKKRGRPSKKR